MIRAEQVRFQYKKRDVDGNVIATEEILKGVELTIKKGEFIALLGRNGSGKTTFSKQLNAILRPSEGTVTVDEMGTRDAEKLYEIRQHVGMVFQNPDNQMVAANVEEEVAFGPENLGMESDTIVARVKQALEQVRMWKRRKTAPNHLSGGQKQRIAIAGILAMHPDYIVLDEPTAMLDPKGRKEVMEALQRLNQEQEMTVILITHDMEEAALASRVILLADGQVRFDGTPEDFFGEDALLAEMGMELKDLPKYPLLLLEDLSNSRRYIDRYAEENGVVLNPILELGSSDLLVSFAEINLGLTYVIEEFTQRELQNKHLFEIPVEPPVPKRSIGMVRLKNVAMPHALKGFIDLIEFPKEKN